MRKGTRWHLVQVQMEGTAEEGVVVKEIKQYMLNSINFADAETLIAEELKPFVSGDFDVKGIRRAKVAEVFFNEDGDRWYKAKVHFTQLDEESGREKAIPSTMMVQADTMKSALEGLEQGMKGSMSDYRIIKLEESKIIEVFKYEDEKEEEVKDE